VTKSLQNSIITKEASIELILRDPPSVYPLGPFLTTSP